MKQYVGLTTDMYGRLSPLKSDCTNGSNNTGLAAHFTSGCPEDTGRGKNNLIVALLDHLDITREEVDTGRDGGVGCVCYATGSRIL